jgi:pimeloyl-ACP methyl ester carboxylesterase
MMPRSSALRSALFAAATLLVSTMLAACRSADGAATTGTASSGGSTTEMGDVAGTIDIGAGRTMYVECRGTGSPTVVLVSGLDAAGDLWDSPLAPPPRVFPTIAEQTRACTYDRPGTTRAIEGGGISRSDPVPQPTTTADAVSDLHALLGALKIDEPVVLVGHSYGGIVSRLYAGTYPADVAGMMLVDSLSPELRADLTAQQWETWNILNARTPEQIADYPDLERIDAGRSLDQLVDAAPIKQMPLVVITADELNGPKIQEQGLAGQLPPGVPADFGFLIDAAHQDAQAQVALLVEGAEHVTAHSGHNVMIDNAPVVIDAIDTIVDAVRDNRSAATA